MDLVQLSVRVIEVGVCIVKGSAKFFDLDDELLLLPGSCVLDIDIVGQDRLCAIRPKAMAPLAVSVAR